MLEACSLGKAVSPEARSSQSGRQGPSTMARRLCQRLCQGLWRVLPQAQVSMCWGLLGLSCEIVREIQCTCKKLVGLL